MPLFFGIERPIEASVDVVALLGTTGYLTYIWSQVDETAAWTMVPYLAWLSFATYLCVSLTFIPLLIIN
jgi:benzodiazapine receptor